MTPMNLKSNSKIKYLVGEENILLKPTSPYLEIVCDLLNELSSSLMKNKIAQQYPDVISFAFWCRRSNIIKLKEKFFLNKNRLGLGIIFHITPSNIPVNFAFSFVFGLLSGNSNIVRVSSKEFEQTRVICESLNEVFKQEKFEMLKKMNVFVKYERDDEITSYFSEISNGRIIWGGDKTIYHIKKLLTSPRCIDIAFSDRFSFCIIDSESILKLEDKQFERLIEGFYNDTFLMDQNACSSPHLVIWTGKNKELAKEKFWNTLYLKVKEKYSLSFVNSVDKYTQFCENAIDLDVKKDLKKYENYLYILNLDSLIEELENHHGKFGYFFEYVTDDLNDLIKIINNKYQTLTYFGIDNKKLKDFVIDNYLMGIDRIVPIGKALDINVIWDGYDIITNLSRIIEVK